MALPKTTKKQQEILTLIPKFRYLHTLHIQQLLNHKGKRRINTWLKNLKINQYIKEIPKGKGLKEHIKPTVYYLDLNGIRWLISKGLFDKKLIHNLYRQKVRSEEFTDQCLFLADIYLELKSSITKEDSLIFYTKTDYSSPTSSFTFLSETTSGLTPDAYFIKQDGRGRKKHYLLHIIPATMLRFRAHKLRRRIREYMDSYFTNVWENHTKKSFPILLFILPDMQALIYLQRFIEKELNDRGNPKIDIRLTTKEKVQERGFTDGSAWEEVE